MKSWFFTTYWFPNSPHTQPIFFNHDKISFLIWMKLKEKINEKMSSYCNNRKFRAFNVICWKFKITSPFDSWLFMHQIFQKAALLMETWNEKISFVYFCASPRCFPTFSRSCYFKHDMIAKWGIKIAEDHGI